MKKVFLVALVAASGVCLQTGGASAIAEQEAPTSWTPRLALDVKSVSNVRASPDGSRALYEVRTAVMTDGKSEFNTQIYVTMLDSGESFQLTRGEKSATGAKWSPDGKWIAFTSSREGGKANLYRIRVAGGEAEKLTDVKTGVSALAWSPDGSHIAYTMPDPPTKEEEKAKKEKRDARVIDENLKMVRLHVIPVETDLDGERSDVTLTEDNYSVSGGFDWSPDGRTIAFSHTTTPKINDWTTADVSIVDVETKSVWTLVATNAAEADPHYSPDGSRIALSISDDPPSWAFAGRVYIISARGSAPRALAATFDEQPAILGWSQDGDAIYVSEGRRTVSSVGVLPVDGGAFTFLTPPDRMVTGATLSKSHTMLGFTSESPTKPAEAFVSAANRFDATNISHVQDLPDLPMGATRVIRWKSKDGMEIEGLLTLPVGYSDGERVPFLTVIHGGPAGAFQQRFIASRGAYPIAAFASDGFAVLRVNPRGSSGYGATFRKANHADWGGADYHDIMTGVDHVIEMGVADPKRMGVMGWSYGGFMTSWVITQTDRFKAASVGAGVTNLMSMTGVTDISNFIPDYFDGNPWEVFENYRDHSAMFHIANAKTPTLIQHGERDHRVPISQDFELYDALKRLGVPTKMVVYPRQPHGVREPQLLLDAMERNMSWFKKWVIGEEAVEETAANNG